MNLAERTTIDWHPQAGLLRSDAEALGDVQATILRAAGRAHGAAVFLSFVDDDEGRRWVRGLAPQLTSMAAQLAASAYPDDGRTGGYGAAAGSSRPGRAPIVTFALSSAGYDALRVDQARRPAHEATPFERGMAAADLGDPKDDGWDDHLRKPHAMVQVLADDEPSLTARLASLLGSLPAGVQPLGEERTALAPAGAAPTEPFGFVDGRSQPRFFSFDVNRDQARNIATYWSAAPPLGWVLCPDPLRPPDASGAPGWGSYLVVRKLEQDVPAFERAQRELAAGLACPPDQAGAVLVGRDRHGRSIENTSSVADHADDNGFLYSDRCPVAAHTRLMNPRDGRAAYPLARRGMTYGSDRPGPVGLLFMANTSDIAGQFEALQRRANGAGGQPFDPIIGQAATVPSQAWTHPDGASTRAAVGGYVTMRGGEYFFMPSLSGLAAL